MTSYIIKVGGSKDNCLEYLADNIASLYRENLNNKFVVVTGGAEILDESCKKRGIWNGRITTPGGKETRYTSAKLIEIFERIYLERCMELTNLLKQRGLIPHGHNGLYNKLLIGKREPNLEVLIDGERKRLTDNHAGKILNVNTRLIESFLDKREPLVTCPPATSYDKNKKIVPINVEGNSVASLIAIKIPTDYLIVLSNVPGLLENKNDESSLIGEIPIIRKTEREFIGIADGRFRETLRGVYRATKKGIECFIGDGRIENPIDSVLNGYGTKILRD